MEARDELSFSLFSCRIFMKRQLIPWMLFSLLAIVLPNGSGQAWAPAKSGPDTAIPDAGLENLFCRKSGWIGGDGVFSVPLNDGRILWLFGDTLIGNIREGRRPKKTEMINNTIAFQRRTGVMPKDLEFFFPIRKGKAASVFVPPNKKGWFWPFHGVQTSSGLYIFLVQIEKTDDPSVFGFHTIGSWLVRIPNPLEKPQNWRMIYSRIPWSDCTQNMNLFWGSAVLSHGDDLYVYGIREPLGQKTTVKSMIVAKIPTSTLDVFRNWTFYSRGTWGKDFRKVEDLFPKCASEFSVTFDSNMKRFLALYSSQEGFSRDILIRSAPKPWGPWSEPQKIYTCPGFEKNPNMLFYAAKHHPELSRTNELVISYATNSLNFEDLFSDAALYFPKFVRIFFSPG